MTNTEQKLSEAKKAKEEKDRQLIADYKSHYRRVTGNQCPEVSIKKAWTSVGNVSFRPAEFESEIKSLASRPDFKDHTSDVDNINLFIALNKKRTELLNTLNELNQIQGLDSQYLEKTNEYVNKAIEEINDIIERKVLFE